MVSASEQLSVPIAICLVIVFNSFWLVTHESMRHWNLETQLPSGIV